MTCFRRIAPLSIALAVAACSPLSLGVQPIAPNAGPSAGVGAPGGPGPANVPGNATTPVAPNATAGPATSPSAPSATAGTSANSPSSALPTPETPAVASTPAPVPKATLKGIVRNADTGEGEPGVVVTLDNGATATTGADGSYTLSAPIGPTLITAAKTRFAPDESKTGVVIGEAGITVTATPILLTPLHWLNQVSGVSTKLRDVFAVDEDHAWVVGGGGTILRTTDGGESWKAAQSAPLVDLSAVFFLNSTSGWAVGRAGTILKSDDGGKNWVPQTSGTTVEIQDIHFSDAKNGWAASDESLGSLYFTKDGGETWRRSEFGRGGSTIHFLDADHGVVWGGSSGRVYVTTSGGATWQSGGQTFGSKVIMISKSEVWAIGNEYVDKSVDGGLTFTHESVDYSCYGPGAMRDPAKRIFEMACDKGNPYGHYGIFFVTPRVGWRVGEGGKIQRY